MLSRTDRLYLQKQNFKLNNQETLIFRGFGTITFKQVSVFTYFVFLNELKIYSVQFVSEKLTKSTFLQVLTKIWLLFMKFSFFYYNLIFSSRIIDSQIKTV